MERKEKKRRYEWLVVQRSKKTGKSIRTISLDPETDYILSQQSNISEFIRTLVKEWAERQRGVTQLTPAEDDIYLNVYHFFSMAQIWSSLGYKGEPFPEQVDDELSTKIFDHVEKRIKDSVEEGSLDAPYYALKLVEKACVDRQFWLELYEKIRINFLQEQKQPKRHSFRDYY